MKKLLSVFLVLMLLGSVALADQYDEYVNQQYDFVNSTDAQLEAYVKLGQALIDNAQAELDKRNGGTEQSESTIDTSLHSVDGFEYSIVKLEKDKDDGQDIVKLYINWKNTGDEPTSLMLTGLMIQVYQSGKEVDSVYLRDNGRSDNYMPGYGGTVVFAFENLDDTEMTFFIKHAFNFTGNDNWSFAVDPNTL